MNGPSHKIEVQKSPPSPTFLSCSARVYHGMLLMSSPKNLCLTHFPLSPPPTESSIGSCVWSLFRHGRSNRPGDDCYGNEIILLTAPKRALIMVSTGRNGWEAETSLELASWNHFHGPWGCGWLSGIWPCGDWSRWTVAQGREPNKGGRWWCECNQLLQKGHCLASSQGL